MAIVSISRGSTIRGREVAEKVAEQLGLRCLAREDVVRDAGLAAVDEAEVVKALDQPPSFLDRLLGGRDHYLATARVALMQQLVDDDVVYHGFAGHFFLQDISHVLKVRVLAARADRVSALMAREGLSAPDAEARLDRIDAARRQWALRVCGVDPEDPSLYDIVLNVGKMAPDDVAQIICDLSRAPYFQSTEGARARLRDQTLAASVEAVLLDMEVSLQDVDITVDDGNVTVRLHQAPRTQAGISGDFRVQYLQSLRIRLHQRTRSIPGLKAVHLE